MNVLQRRMFQTGGPSDKLIQVEPVNSELVRYYVQQGYSPLEIQEVYPAANLGIIEQIAREEGGSLNPAVSLGESFTGSPVVTPAQRADIISESISTPVGNLSFESSADPELPRMEDISVVPKSVRDYITNAGGVLDRANLVRGLGVSFNMSEAEANSAIDLVTGSTVPERTTVDTPGLPGLADVMTGEQAEIASSTLGPNQYRASDGKVYNIDPNKFSNQLEVEDSRIIGGLLMNPNVEYGSNLSSIVEEIARKRSSTLVPEENIRVGQGIQGLNTADVLQSGAKAGVDVVKEGIESLYNIARAPFTNPTIAGIFGSRERAKSLRESGAGDRVNLFETGLDDVNLNNPFRAGQALVTGGFDEYFKTGAEKPETLDAIVAESSTGQVEQAVEDEIGKELQDLENQEQTDKVNAEAAGSEIEDAVADETQADAEDVADTVTDEEGDKTEEQKKSDATPPVVSSASTPEQVGTIFNNPEFIDYVANLSKGIAKTGEVGSGLALGSALAAEERSLKDLEREKLDQELLLKSLEGGQLELKDRKTILDVQTGMSESVRDYNNAVAAQELAQSVIDFANKNESLATFGAKIGASVEDIKAAIGANRVTNVDQLSDTKRAQIALDILANRNIKEILGESGRTISNIDRDIANRIIGNLSMRKIQSVAELKNRLGDNIKSIIQKRNEAQRNIRSSVQFLAPYNPNILGQDSELFQIFQRELGIDPISGQSERGQEFSIDMTGEFNQ
jgi:hypothetical protein